MPPEKNARKRPLTPEYVEQRTLARCPPERYFLGSMPRDDPEDERDDRDERGFSFRQRLSGLLDPDGAFGKSRDYVADLASGTKSEVVRIVSREVRTFLDQMDTVDLLQQVIAGLVIDVNAQVRFSFEDNEGTRELKTRLTRQETKIRGNERKRGANKRGENAGPEEPAEEPEDE